MEQQEQFKKRLRIALRMAEALQKEARRIVDLPVGMRPEVVTGAGKQFNELTNWLQQELGIRLPVAPLPDDPDPFALSLAVTQLVGALQVILGEEGIVEVEVKEEEVKERKREPVLRVRDQRSPTEFSEVVIASAEELAELLRTGLPEWIKTVVKTATATEKAVAEAVTKAQQETSPAPKPEPTETVRVAQPEAGQPLHERLEEVGDWLEDIAEDLEEIDEEWQEAAEEGELTEERRAKLATRRQKLLQQVREALQALQQALGQEQSPATD